VTESALERLFVREARRKGFMVLKLNVRGQRGWPDRLLVGRGGVRFVELKRPGAPISTPQLRVMRGLSQRGVEVVIVRSERDFPMAFAPVVR